MRGFSQLVTSFVASESQGILHVPFSPFLFSFKESRLSNRFFFAAVDFTRPAASPPREIVFALTLYFAYLFDLLVIFGNLML